MSTDQEEAFQWEGDEPSRATAVPRTPVAKGFDPVDAREGGEDDPVEREPRATSNAMLVTLGVLGGVYALYAVGWVIGAVRLAAVSAYLVTPAGGTTPPLWGAGTALTSVLAVAATLVWFLATLALTRGRPSWVRIAALVAGVALLVPWPFVSVGAVGA